MFRRLIAFILFFAALTPALHARGVVATPAQLGLVVTPGKPATETIEVFSPGGEVNEVKVSIVDYVLDDAGRLTQVSSPHARSARRFLEVDQAVIQAPATGRVPLQVVARVPEGSAGSYWAAVALAVYPKPAAGKNKVAVGVVARILVPVILTVNGPVDIQLLPSPIETFREDGKLRASMWVENRGNAAVLLSGAFAVETKDREGLAEELASANIVKPVTSLPGTKVRVYGTIDWNGDSTEAVVRAYLRYGNRKGDSIESEGEIGSQPGGKGQ